MNSLIENTENSEKTIQEDDYYSIIGHPHRRSLLEFLEENPVGTIKDFQEELKFRTGTLYHHLAFLKKKEMIYQNNQREYLLTEKGKEITKNFLENKQNNSSENIEDIEKKNSMISNVLLNSFSKVIRTFDTLLNYCFVNKMIITVISLISILGLFFGMITLELGIFGTFFYSMKDIQVSTISFLISIILVGVLIKIVDTMSEKNIPIDQEFIISINLLYIPIGIGLLATTILIETFKIPEILFISIIIIELLSQIYWIVLIYLILRKFNGLDEKWSLINSLLINYCFLLINLLFV